MEVDSAAAPALEASLQEIVHELVGGSASGSSQTLAHLDQLSAAWSRVQSEAAQAFDISTGALRPLDGANTQDAALCREAPALAHVLIDDFLRAAEEKATRSVALLPERFQRREDDKRSALEEEQDQDPSAAEPALSISTEDWRASAAAVRLLCGNLQRGRQWLAQLGATPRQVQSYRARFRAGVQQHISRHLVRCVCFHAVDRYWSEVLHSAPRDAASNGEDGNDDARLSLLVLTPAQMAEARRKHYRFLQRARAVGLARFLDDALEQALVESADAFVRMACAYDLPEDGPGHRASGASTSSIRAHQRRQMKLKQNGGKPVRPIAGFFEASLRYQATPARAAAFPPGAAVLEQVKELLSTRFAEAAALHRFYIAGEVAEQYYDFDADLAHCCTLDGDDVSPDSLQAEADTNGALAAIDPPPIALLRDELAPIVAAEAHLAVGCMYHELQRVRIWQFFDCITARPQRHGVLIDLGACIAHTKEMAKVSAAINQVIRERLLHPGAQTRDIIEYFVLLIHSLRETQASDVLLSRLAPPIRKYLRSRPDTVSVVVNSLLGNHETFKLLREELDRTKNIKTPFTLEATQIGGSGGGGSGGKSAAGGGKGRGGADEAEDDTSEEEVDLDDLNWRPRPIDAGPNYRKTGKSDVISMLVSIFDDREGFMQALERTMAEQLLSIKGYQHDEQYASNATLKSRFGETHFHRIDNMINDVVNSRRDHRDYAKSVPQSRLGADSETEQQLELERALHPIIVSRYSWPDLNVEPPASGGVGAAAAASAPSYAATTASGADAPLRIPGAERPEQRLPARFLRALERFTHDYRRRKLTQTVRFLPGLGTMDLTLQMDDGRTLRFERVTALQAAVVDLAAQRSAASSSATAAAAAAASGSTTPGSGTVTGTGAAEGEGERDSTPGGGKSNAMISAAEVALELEVEKNVALAALYFWSAQGVLREVGAIPDTFEVVDRL